MSKYPLLPVSLRLCPNSCYLRHFDLPLPDHVDRTAIPSYQFHNWVKNPLFAVLRTLSVDVSQEIALFRTFSTYIVDIQFLPVTDDNLNEVKAIYDWFIAHSTATFHTEPIAHAQLKTFLFVGDPVYRSYLMTHNGVVAGYCFLTKYKDRPAYRRTAEVTIYLRPEFQGRGLGSAALQRLIKDARETGLKTLLALISGGNESSIALFTKSGFTKCAHFRNVGEKFNQVLDVLGYQLEL